MAGEADSKVADMGQEQAHELRRVLGPWQLVAREHPRKCPDVGGILLMGDDPDADVIQPETQSKCGRSLTLN